MKKILLFAAFVTVVTLTGCNKGNDTPYLWVIEVTNETDKEIVITNKIGETIHLQTTVIAPGASGTTLGVLSYGPNRRSGSQPDNLVADDILPFGNATTVQLPDGEYWLSMTIGGMDISGEVWKRKHWSFKSTMHDRWYSLTITDAFIESLMH